MSTSSLPPSESTTLARGAHRSTFSRRDWLGMAGLALLVLVSRIPLRSQILYHWDSVNFAYAMQRFDLANEQPQPPGYLVYVWLCRLVDLIFHDAQVTMVSISIAASLAAVIGMVFLGRAMYNARVGWMSAAFLAVSPLFWFYGEIALPHTLDAMLVIWSLVCLYQTMMGDRRYLIPAVLLLAIAGGVRQQTLVFLAPVALYAVRKVGLARIAGSAAMGAAVCLAWAVPLVTLSGGLTAYLDVMGAFSDRFQSTTSVFMGAGWWGIRRNAIKLIFYSAFGWNIVLVPVLVVFVQRLRSKTWPKPGERSGFLALWLAPAILFYIFIHMGQQGLVFIFLPALLILSAAALDEWLTPQFSILLVSAIMLVLISGSIFLFLPEYPLGPGTQRLLTRQTLSNHDRYFLGRLGVIRENFSADQTIILAASWHHVQYYLPEYKTLGFDLGAKWEVDEGLPSNQGNEDIEVALSTFGLDSAQSSVIIFDPELLNFNESPDQVRSVPLAEGEMLHYLTLQGQDRFYVSQGSFGLVRR